MTFARPSATRSPTIAAVKGPSADDGDRRTRPRDARAQEEVRLAGGPDGLDLSVPSGVIYGFLGPDGAGKTTTMRMLTGLIRPDSGTIDSRAPFARGDRRRLFEVGALIESPSFYPYLSGRENLRALAAGRRDSRRRIEERAQPRRPAGPRTRQGPGLFAGHEAAPGHRRRAAQRPAAPAAR